MQTGALAGTELGGSATRASPGSPPLRLNLRNAGGGAVWETSRSTEHPSLPPKKNERGNSSERLRSLRSVGPPAASPPGNGGNAASTDCWKSFSPHHSTRTPPADPRICPLHFNNVFFFHRGERWDGAAPAAAPATPVPPHKFWRGELWGEEKGKVL